MVNHIFDLCVEFLITLSELLGTTYKAINVWIFVIIWPVLTIILIIIIVVQNRKIKMLKRK